MDRKNDARHTIRIAVQPSLPHTLQHYPKMVLPSVNTYFRNTDNKKRWVIVVAQDDHTRQGLIVAFFNSNKETINVASWYVTPEHTNQGLGQKSTYLTQHRISHFKVNIYNHAILYV